MELITKDFNYESIYSMLSDADSEYWDAVEEYLTTRYGSMEVVYYQDHRQEQLFNEFLSDTGMTIEYSDLLYIQKSSNAFVKLWSVEYTPDHYDGIGLRKRHRLIVVLPDVVSAVEFKLMVG